MECSTGNASNVIPSTSNGRRGSTTWASGSGQPSISFHDSSVAQTGQVLQWDLSGGAPKELFRFDVPKVFFAARSPDGKWLAVSADKDTKMRVEARTVDGKAWRVWRMPFGQFPHSLAFDPQSKHLAVGTRNVAQHVSFYKELGGNVRIYSLDESASLPREGPAVQGRALTSRSVPCRASWTVFRTTRKPRVVQNRMSVAVKRYVPRIQNHW